MIAVLFLQRSEDPSFVFLVFRAVMNVFWFAVGLFRSAAIFLARS